MVPDAERLRTVLRAAGAVPGFRGLMEDRRYDRNGTLLAKDEVLRVRSCRPRGEEARSRLGWKGPVSVTPDGYKQRRELEYQIGGAHPPGALLEALGFSVIQEIDRWVEYYELGGAVIRVEWYPRMDVLVEIEGDGAAIEAGVRASGLPRGDFTAEALPAFAERFAARTGQSACLAVADLGGAPAPWERW